MARVIETSLLDRDRRTERVPFTGPGGFACHVTFPDGFAVHSANFDAVSVSFE